MDGSGPDKGAFPIYAHSESMTANTMSSRFNRWLKRNSPSRESLEGNRWVGFAARRPELWRLTRRSVPRGVAIGLLIGILALIPGVQMIGAALLCVPTRGHIPIAAAMTFLSNPLTTPFLVGAALEVGASLGFRSDFRTFFELYNTSASIGEWFDWLASDAAPGLIVGLAIIATLAAAIGYLVSSFVWTRVVNRRRSRQLAGRQKPG